MILLHVVRALAPNIGAKRVLYQANSVRVWSGFFELAIQTVHLKLQIVDLALQVVDVLVSVVEISRIHPSCIAAVSFIKVGLQKMNWLGFLKKERYYD